MGAPCITPPALGPSLQGADPWSYYLGLSLQLITGDYDLKGWLVNL